MIPVVSEGEAGERKQAEIDYPQAIGEDGRAWLRSKPFGNEPRETARLLIGFGYGVQLLDLRAGMSLCQLGFGSGWMTRFPAGHRPGRLERLLGVARLRDTRRFHITRKRLFSNAPSEVAAHVAGPLVYRALGPFWTQIWLRARAT